MHLPADIAIICALASELRKVLKTGGAPWIKVESQVQSFEPTTYWRTTWARPNGENLHVVAAVSSQMGMPAAAVLTAKMISRFDPALVAMVGIAAGVKEDGRGFGDILVPDRTFDYGAGKISEGDDKKLEFRPDPQPISLYPILLERVKFWKEHHQPVLAHIQQGWDADPPNTRLRMHIGPLGSGSQVLAAQQPVEQIRDHWRKLIGIEMEAHGVNVACQDMAHPPRMFLCMKSVCDFADSEKNDDWQAYAAYTAAQLFHRFVIEEWDNLNTSAIRGGHTSVARTTAAAAPVVESASVSQTGDAHASVVVAAPAHAPPLVPLPLRMTANPWSAAAVGSSLWTPGDAADSWRAVVQMIVDACHAMAVSFDGEDAWRDDELPVRVLGVMESLVRDSVPAVMLELPEAALVIVAPFLREAAVAGGVAWMSAARPFELTIEEAAIGPRIALDREHQARAPLVRKAMRLLQQRREQEYRAVAMWMMHECIGREPALWELPPHGHFPGAVRATLNEARQQGDAMHETFAWNRVRELARCVFADPERIDRDDRPDSLAVEERILGAAVRPKMLGYLLCLASWMAMDVRRLPELLVEHIGLADALDPRDVIETLRRARWERCPAGLQLSVTCGHPAIDYALRFEVQRAGAVLDRIHARAATNHARIERLVGLPKRLTADDVRPAFTDNGHPAYSTPHLRFELAHEEVKELLMGEQLYGDPTLAIRELYQNALDACRYREAREAFLRQTGRGRPSQQWAGEIRFRQDSDGSRPYIECEDNGVGMGLAELEGCFARAGKRFHDMPEFIEEQTEWLRVEPPLRLYPNSQFGVGVFSYFMLADEIEVETCRFQRDGSLGPQLRIRIAGSGSLFRVQELGQGHKAGSRVRLYLNKTEVKTAHGAPTPISCSNTLRNLLLVAEYATTCSERGMSELYWTPNELSAHAAQDAGQICRIHEDVWCVRKGSAAVLADGIKTAKAINDHTIINLRHARRPTLTVDRSAVQKFDQDWVMDLIYANWQTVAMWPDLTIDFLWWLESIDPETTETIVSFLTQQRAKIYSDEWSGSTEISQIGCLRSDKKILEYCRNFDEAKELYDAENMPSLPEPLLRQRIEVFRRLGVRVPQEFDNVLPYDEPDLSVVVPRVGDAYLLEEFDRGSRPISLVFIAHASMLTIFDLYNRLQRYVPLGVELPELTRAELSELDFIPTTQDTALLSRWGDGSSPQYSKSISSVILLASAAASCSDVESLLELVHRFRALGVSPPDLSLEELRELHPLVREHLAIFSRDLDGQPPFLSSTVSSFHIFAAAAATRQSTRFVYDVLHQFEGHGISLPLVDRKNMPEHIPSPSEVEQISNAFPWWRMPESAAYSIVASEGNVTKLKLAHHLGRVTGTWTLPREPVDLDKIVIDVVDRQILSRDFKGKEGLASDTIPMAHVRGAARALGLDLQEVLRRLRVFEPLGLRIATK